MMFALLGMAALPAARDRSIVPVNAAMITAIPKRMNMANSVEKLFAEEWVVAVWC
jgi:hypothetical protein